MVTVGCDSGGLGFTKRGFWWLWVVRRFTAPEVYEVVAGGSFGGWICDGYRGVGGGSVVDDLDGERWFAVNGTEVVGCGWLSGLRGRGWCTVTVGAVVVANEGKITGVAVR